ncbi:MAG TPA: vWA domain-containing protein [Opitutales bacterium]|nr:vWA domain-containing protein [Opitutales bacterium]
MKADLTYIAFILDRSGSMQSMAEEAIGGFNAFLKEQQNEEGDARLSLILFDHEYTPVVENRLIDEVEPLSAKTYEPRGTTALLDAMGRTIDDLGKQMAAMPEEARPETVIVVTLTDGLENSSKDYTRAKVAERIKHQEEKYGWEFMFLGANMESINEARDFGIQKACSKVFDSVEEGMAYSSKEVLKRRRKAKKNKIGF